ncbi:hypothetical protein LEP1GSC158_2259 [Leptospira interrogans serovar Zanoni str. LT2156]|uniref:Uncharacterized protein n=1 Tax=Leptospira interrogans serovar Zanoni str. LT2156 TaxID=1001601 RepID=M6HGN5_LEPIR|nr:hypothetical protein LEP1GSC158_2259 [Leptospira interrogans serovar Zanoni str. LT2156]
MKYGKGCLVFKNIFIHKFASKLIVPILSFKLQILKDK